MFISRSIYLVAGQFVQLKHSVTEPSFYLQGTLTRSGLDEDTLAALRAAISPGNPSGASATRQAWEVLPC